jgi:hypothetical protein
MIYGYAAKEVNDFGLFEMKEITFVASPEVLREVAYFLNTMADLMEAGGFSNTHRHIGNTVKNWDKRFPGKDVIVIPPSDT